MASIVDYLLLGTAIYKGAQAIRTDIYQSRNATPGKNSRNGWCSLMVSLTNENFIGPVPAKIPQSPSSVTRWKGFSTDPE